MSFAPFTLPPFAQILKCTQMQVLRLMGRYQTPREIADQLGTSINAIYSVQYRIRILMDVATNEQAITEALRRGWLKHD